MKRSAAIASIVLASFALTGTSLARQPKAPRDHAATMSLEPDQVIQWNQQLLTLLQLPGAQPATIHPTRTLAITQLAVYNAVNAIEGGYAPYRFGGVASEGASANAAAAAAAHAVL